MNDRLVRADIAGLVQSYESHHIFVRAHFPVDARGAKISLESRLAELTSGSHVTQVTYGAGEGVQVARLDAQSNKATFEPFEANDTGTSGSISPGVSDFTAAETNERIATVLLALVFFAATPPAIFFVVSTRFATKQDQVFHGAFH